jgi:hypothetical protein
MSHPESGRWCRDFESLLADDRQERERTTTTQRERHRPEHGYLPPRLAQAEAIQEAALMSDRFERAFPRLVREFRNQRRIFASLVVAGGRATLRRGHNR